MTKEYSVRLHNYNGTDTLIVGSTVKDCYKLLLKDTDKLTETEDTDNVYKNVLRSIIWALDDMETDEPDLMTKQLESRTRKLVTMLNQDDSLTSKTYRSTILDNLRSLLPLLSNKRLQYIFNRIEIEEQ